MVPIKPPDISEAVNNALKNLSDSPTKVIGSILADLLSIPAIKAKYLKQKVSLTSDVDFQNFVESIVQKTNTIEKEKLVAPNIQVVGNAAENAVYCLSNKDLSDMFASLISNSCNIDYSSVMHPSFSETLKQLSPYDAMLFKKLSEKTYTSAAQFRRNSKYSSEYVVLYPCIPYTDPPFDNIDMENVSISALKHLGLIEYEIDPFFPGPLKRFTECKYYQSLRIRYMGQEFIPAVKTCRISLTPYGKSFATACSLRPV